MHKADGSKRQKSGSVVKVACVNASPFDNAAKTLCDGLGSDPLAFVILLVSPDGDLQALSSSLEKSLNCSLIIGARTAGEICDRGYSESRVVALGFPSTHFNAGALLLESTDQVDELELGRQVLALRQELQSSNLGFDNEFAFLLVDGLSQREDSFLASISTALGSTQLFGGSSGDGLEFADAPILYNGKLCRDSAILLLARSTCAVKIFREDHFEPSDIKLIVTGAVPGERLVTEINAEPAAPEYARVIGIEQGQLSPFLFAAHPLLVTLGEQHHVRAIQEVEENQHLRFFSSIDEGMVLTVAKAKNITEHLSQVLEKLSKPDVPDVIFTCDCILRRLEAEQKQSLYAMSQLFRQHRVFGFSTYGEQHNMLHVNQTLTGIAFYPPPDD